MICRVLPSVQCATNTDGAIERNDIQFQLPEEILTKLTLHI